MLEWGGPPQPPAEGEADRLLDHTVGYWRDWLRRTRYQGRYREMVERSALVLKLLVYQPTGALVAAPTTSLPEFAGGARNWDYRYTWIRDAAFTLYGLMRLGFTDGCPIGYKLWEALGRQLDWLEKHWQLPDDGIWESRGGRRRSTYSVLMTWVALERAIRIGRQRGLPTPIAHWRGIANSSYQVVQREGWSPDRRAYVQYFGGNMLDASLLVMPLVKFAGPRGPRFLATLERIGEELVSDSLVRRYEPDGSDGLPGSEGTFNLCSSW